ncbi:MAG TPA: mechanosensitive ion channel family protein [Acidimicrobiia bacterium]|nr:mechanosensitive ion channel family protein [Acidimicrobiia bacterium]
MPTPALALPASLLSAGNAADLQRACGPVGSRTWLCETVFRITGSNGAADVADAAARPVRIVFVVLLAWAATRLLRRVVRHLVDRLKVGPESGTAAKVRRRQRADTVAAVLNSLSAVVVWSVAVITVLGELGLDLAPLLAGAGVAGVALGFGAQTVVRDFLAGTFMLLEDQFGVGDIIDVGVPTGTAGAAVSGTVESVTLRVTRVRDVEGVVWHVPNGEIRRLGNKGQQWSRTLLDIAVVPETSIPHARDVIGQVAHDLWRDDAWQRRIVAEPEVWGVEDLTGQHIVIRLVIKTLPIEQWNVARELRARLKDAFDTAGIVMAVPRSVVIAPDGPGPPPPTDESETNTDG